MNQEMSNKQTTSWWKKLKASAGAMLLVLAIVGSTMIMWSMADAHAGEAGLVKAHWKAIVHKPSMVKIGDSEAVLYTAEDGKLMFQSGGRTTHINSGGTEGVVVERSLLMVQGNALYVAWRELYSEKGKPGGHVLKFRASRNGGASFDKSIDMVKTEGTPLGYFDLKVGSEGELLLAWSHASRQEAGIYLAVSKNGGKKWRTAKVPESWVETHKTAETKNDGKDAAKTPEPKVVYGAPRLFQMLHHGNQLDMAWIEPNPDGGVRIRSSTSTDQGGTWGKPQTMVAAHVINQFRLVRHQDRSYVFWTGQQEKEPVVYTLNGAALNMKGQWEAIKTQPKLYSAFDFQVNVAANDKFTNMIFTASYRETVNAVEQVYTLSFDTATQTWNEPQLLASNKPRFTSAMLPEMAARVDGTVVVWWNDYRNVRGNVFMDVSRDFGKTWLKQDVPVSPSAAYVKAYGLKLDDDGNVFGYWLEHTDGDIRDLRLKTYRANVAGIRSEEPAQPHGEKHLRERVKQFWTARMAGDVATDYALLDPISRANLPVLNYRYDVNVQFKDYTIKRMTINGNFAKVEVEFTASLPAGALGFGSKATDPKKETTEMRWAWIDGDWYRVFDPNRQVMYIPYYPE